MDFPLCVMDGLREIYNLVDVIHRQRRVNRKTYLRLVEIYVELQMSESLLLNARLQRTDAIGRFTKVVDTFYMYLRKYHDMRWHGRIFKQAAMEEERVKVVDEIDRLLKILNLTSNIAVIKGEAVASTNALKLFSRLKHIHGDIKFTHGHIHAALLADRHQIELTRTKKMPEPEPVVEHKKRASILRTNSSVLMSVEKDDTLPTFEKNSTGEAIQLPETILENVEGGDQSASYDEEEEKAPVTVNAELVQGTPDVMVGATLPMDELKNSGPENVMENSLYEMEEKAPLCFKLELVSIDDEEICSSILETEEIKKDELKLRITDEKFGTNNCKIIKKGTTVDVVEDKNEQTSPLVNTFTGEVEETRDRSQRLQYSTSSTAEDPSVPLLIQLLGSNDATSQQKEEALLRLLRKCINNNNRVQIYKTKGIPVLAHLVRSSDNFFTQLYALHCLSWFTFSYSKMRESEFVELQRCVRHPTHPEILSLLHELQLEDEQVKEVAVLQCSCLATRGDGVVLRQVGVLPPVIELLKTGTSNQKLWAAETLVTLASDDDDNCEAIMDGGAIPPLVTLLRSGTDMQKQEAAFALGNLAANNEVNRVKIAREGAIPPMVEFVKAVTDAQNQWAVYALGFLSVNNEENRVLIAQEGAIPSLVALLRTGTRAQKLWAAYTLGNLAHNDDNRVKITQEGAIASLVNLLRTGTAMVKQRAVFALGNLAGDNDVATDFDEAILPLVDLVRTGSDTQMEDAAYTLGKLASNNNDSRAEIGQRGAIPPLVKLLKIGHDDQKQWAAFALRYLAYNNDVNRVAIVEEGAIPSLLLLMDEGTDEQKEQASHALKHLVAKNDVITHAFIPNRLMVWGDIVDPLVGSASRWHSSHIGVMQTPDRLGDSLVTTLRSSTLKVINDSQIVALWSRKLVKQLVEYEREDRILVRLADTGRVLTTLFLALKTSAEVLNIRDPEAWTQWRDQFMMEREERMNLYESLLNDKTQLVVEMGNEKQQLEIMTRMKNDVEMYGGVFNTTELDVISAIYDEVVQYSGFVVGCIPSWFATTETSWCDGESTHLEMNEEELLRQVAPWSGLRHPYVMKLYGACHVGRPFVIHESSCAERVDELPWKEVLSVALGLEYIQERGYRHQQTTLLRLSTDKKLVLSGLNLVEIDASHGADEANVKLFTFALLELLQRTRKSRSIASTQYLTREQLPKTQPDFVTDREWTELFSYLCTTIPSERLTTAGLVMMLRNLSTQDVDAERIQSSNLSNVTMVDVETFVLRGRGLSIKDILHEIDMICEDNLENINNFVHVKKRMVDLYQQIKAAGVQVPLPIIDRFCEILGDFLLHLKAQQINHRSSTDSINSLFSEEIDDSNYDLLVHHQIDYLVAVAPVLQLYSPVHDWTLLRQHYQEDALATWQQMETRTQAISYDEGYENFSDDSEEEEDPLGSHILEELVQRERFVKNAVAINFLRIEVEKHLAAYESHSRLLIQWAHTGRIVRILLRAIESAMGILGIKYVRNSWHDALQAERDRRAIIYRKRLDDGHFNQEMKDQHQIRELRTVLGHALHKYGTTLSLLEHEFTLVLINTLERKMSEPIMPFPNWFAMSEDEWSFAQKSSLHGSENECVRQVELWAKLNHPNVRKFYGAYHVGITPFAIHDESTRLSSTVIHDNGNVWRILLDYARGLQYVHSQGCAHVALSMEHLCVTWDNKFVLNGLGLVSSSDSNIIGKNDEDTTGSQSSDVLAFGVIILQILAMTRIPDKYVISRLPVNRIHEVWLQYLCRTEWTPMIGMDVSDSSAKAIIVEVVRKMTKYEWDLVEAMCTEQPARRMTMATVSCYMESLAGMVLSLTTKKDISTSATPVFTINCFREYVYPLSGQTLYETLDSLHEPCNHDQSDNRSVYKRLMDIYAQLRDTVTPVPLTVVEHFGMIIHKFAARVDGCSDQMLGVSVSESAVLTVADRNHHFHRQLDDLVGGPNVLNSENPVHNWQTHSPCSQKGNVNYAQGKSKWILSSEQVQIGEPIARGAFGETYWGKWIGTDVVIKRVLTNQGIPHFRQQFYHEAKLWFSLNHVNLVKLYGTCEESNAPPIFVCERAIHGTLSSFLKGKPREEIWGSLYSAAQGLQYLHEHGIVHCDLKGNNVLVCDNNLVKLADFGLSTLVGSSIYVNNEKIGALRWKAPECFDKSTSSFTSDIFAFGMCVVEVVTGEFPWGNATSEEAVKNNIKAKISLPRPNEFSNDEWDLVERMCHDNPDDRISVGAAVCLMYELYAGSDSFVAQIASNIESVRTEVMRLLQKNAIRRRGCTRVDNRLLPEWFIPIYHIDHRSNVISGFFAKIYRARWLGTDVVVKEVRAGLKDIVRFTREVTVWFSLKHQNVIQLYGACHVGQAIFVCEWASNGELRDYIKRKDRRTMWKCLSDAARGLQYLHTNGVIHGNLKGDTILVCKNGIAKLASFAFSFFAGSPDVHIASGAIQWMAPELLEGEKPTFASDIFALGMCVIEAAAENYPWGNAISNQVVKYNVVNQKRLPPRPSTLNDKEWDIVRRMCRFEPDNRIGIEAVVCCMEHFSTMHNEPHI